MLEGSQNAKNKQDAAWRQFITLLEYKGDLHGTHVVPVEPAGTTKECSECGVETDKPLWVREHSCPACGHGEDRDLNAAKNVLDRGLDNLCSDDDIGAGCSESTPVQTALPVFASVQVDAKRVVEAGSPAA
ncbi:IS1341-type transposase [Halococcus thailandensis JCM 13552]|uniref:IS1341-type transposase n=1 Tax=Halococcus thailandensis JCM 13552 TaxID=1227457 RepID=M0MUQ2_9EURY|nr:IS1341-type transposase [Halococcus thailandensis JCM 13552]